MGKPRNGTARLTSVKNLKNAALDTQEIRLFSEAEPAPATQEIEADPATLRVNGREPEKVKPDGCADAIALQGEQMGLETLHKGQACVNLSEEQKSAAECQDDSPMCHEQDCNAAAAAAAESVEEEPSEEVKITPRAEPSPQETGKQRRRKKRRERLRQNAKA
jgi:hypothetical protein